MSNHYKPADYNSVSPYFIVEGAQALIDLLKQIFDAKEMRRFDTVDGKIMHVELQIDDSIIMMSDATADYPANKMLLHVYVADVDAVYTKAMEKGCIPVEAPSQREGDPDRRGTFTDSAGNMWSVGTQVG